MQTSHQREEQPISNHLMLATNKNHEPAEAEIVLKRNHNGTKPVQGIVIRVLKQGCQVQSVTIRWTDGYTSNLPLDRIVWTGCRWVHLPFYEELHSNKEMP